MEGYIFVNPFGQEAICGAQLALTTEWQFFKLPMRIEVNKGLDAMRAASPYMIAVASIEDAIAYPTYWLAYEFEARLLKPEEIIARLNREPSFRLPRYHFDCGTEISDHRLFRVDIRHSTVDHARFNRVLWSRANMSRASIHNTGFRDCNLETCVVQAAMLSATGFNGCKMNDTSFAGTMFYNVTVEGCILRRCDFTGAFLSGTTFRNTAFEDCVLSTAGFRETTFIDCEFISTRLNEHWRDEIYLHNCRWE